MNKAGCAGEANVEMRGDRELGEQNSLEMQMPLACKPGDRSWKITVLPATRILTARWGKGCEWVSVLKGEKGLSHPSESLWHFNSADDTWNTPLYAGRGASMCIRSHTNVLLTRSHPTYAWIFRWNTAHLCCLCKLLRGVRFWAGFFCLVLVW